MTFNAAVCHIDLCLCRSSGGLASCGGLAKCNVVGPYGCA